MKRVAILLFGNLSEALRQRSTRAATSKPYWVEPGQFHEFDGGVELIPAMAGDVLTYANRNDLRPLGFVIVKGRGEYLSSSMAPQCPTWPIQQTTASLH